MSITLPATRALLAGFAAVIPHASADKVTPIITGVRVDQRYVIATDRYSVARFEHTTYAESIERHGEDGPADPLWNVVLPADIAVWISKLKLIGTTGEELTITDDTVTFSRYGAAVESRGFAPIEGSYPPVERLIPGVSNDAVEVAPFHLGAAMLGKLSKSIAPLARADKAKDLPMRFQVQLAHRSSSFPGPILATVGDRFLILAQPVKIAG